MFSALKKLGTSSKVDDNGVHSARGLQTMSQSLQQKFSKGVQYNMKIIIKGDRNVGKTCLFHRLQGHTFVENYTPTDEIQVTNIQWSYKVTDDVVKVEVWDVVDKGKKRVLADNLKLEQLSMSQPVLTPALDAEFLDVYKNANGVILVLDVTKNWTFEYAQREIDKIPDTVPVLILGNHCDMGHHRTVSADHISYYIESLQRVAPIRYAESSMSNGFGLKFIHKWFNLPFLQLQRETLLAQLKTNEREISVTTQELDAYQQSDESNYDLFSDRLSIHRRKVAEFNSVIPPSCSVPSQPHNKGDVTPVRSQPQNKGNVISIPKAENIKSPITSMPVHLVISNGAASLPAETNDQGSHINKVYGKGKEIILENVTVNNASEVSVSDRLNTSLRNIDEFMPDESLDRSFLDDPTSPVNTNQMRRNEKHNSDSDSDADIKGNPLVLEFQDDIDSADELSFKKCSTPQASTNDIDYNESYADNWIRSTESRRSPDGGEDNTKVDLLNSDEKAENNKVDKKEKTHKSVKNYKEKSKKKKSKKEKLYSKEHNELEEFLNCPADGASYEAL